MPSAGLEPATLASPPTRGAWIEIQKDTLTLIEDESPPTRGAWIEMPLEHRHHTVDVVAPHTGGVD